MKLYCDNKSAISITHNSVQHDRTKYIEVDKHFIKEKLDSGLICALYVSSQSNLADLLTKGLNYNIFERIVLEDLLISMKTLSILFIILFTMTRQNT
jgi:hypothetical protein